MPRGRQLQLYLTPRDLHSYEATLRERPAEWVALASHSPGPGPNRVGSLAIREMGKERLTVFLVRTQDLGAISVRQVKEQRYWTIDELRSPVIEFQRCFFDGQLLRRGRLYYVTGYYGDNGAWIAKPASFIEWASGMLRATRKALQRVADLGAYLGDEARRLHLDGLVDLVWH